MQNIYEINYSFNKMIHKHFARQAHFPLIQKHILAISVRILLNGNMK